MEGAGRTRRGLARAGAADACEEPGTGRDCGVGEEGELWCRGDNVMKGYYKRPDVTRECIDQQGWFHSGKCNIHVVYMDTTSFPLISKKYLNCHS